MTYTLYIKSHTEAPDLEDQVEAESKEEAIKYFVKRLEKYGWNRDMIEANVISEEEWHI